MASFSLRFTSDGLLAVPHGLRRARSIHCGKMKTRVSDVVKWSRLTATLHTHAEKQHFRQASEQAVRGRADHPKTARAQRVNAACGAAERGSCTVKVVPAPLLDRTEISPPWARIISLQM